MGLSRLVLLSAIVFVNYSGAVTFCGEKIRLFEEALLRPDRQALAVTSSDPELQAFEREALEVMASNPDSNAAWENLARRWELGAEELKTIQAYSRLLRNENATSDSLTKDLAHLSNLGRKRFFEENPEVKARYDFYKSQVGKLSVPEMAAQLKMSEIRVRRELSQWQISVIEAFGDDTGDGSTQASRFVRHFANVKSRGVSWQRQANFEGKLASEIDILTLLYERGFDNTQIAKKLNEVFQMKESDPDYRSVGSVAEKKRELNLVARRPHQIKDLEVKGYGRVKEAGVLITESTSKFIFDHREKGVKWIAQQLSVKPENVRDFNKRHGLEGLFKKNTPELLRKERESVLDRYAEHLIKTGNFLSTQNNKEWTTLIGVSIDKTLGYGRYSDDSPQAPLRLFDGLANFYSDLYEVTKAKLLNSELELESQQRILEKIRTQEQEYLLLKRSVEDQRENAKDRLLAHLIASNPTKIPLSNGPEFHEISGVDYEKWTGQGFYEGKYGDGPALNESPLAAYEDLYEHARSYFETSDVDPKKQEEILLELEAKISFHERALLKTHEKNILVFESLYAHLLDKGSFPSSAYNVWIKSVPFRYVDFTTSFNKNPGTAFRRFHRWLRSKLKSENVDTTKQKELLALSEAKAFDFEFEALSFQQKRQVAAQRIIKHFITSGIFPKNSDLKKNTGIGAARFFNYAKATDESVLNRDAQAAFSLLEEELELQLKTRNFNEARKEELRRAFAAARGTRRP